MPLVKKRHSLKMFVTCCLLLASLWGLLASAFCQVPTLFFIQIPVISHHCLIVYIILCPHCCVGDAQLTEFLSYCRTWRLPQHSAGVMAWHGHGVVARRVATVWNQRSLSTWHCRFGLIFTGFVCEKRLGRWANFEETREYMHILYMYEYKHNDIYIYMYSIQKYCKHL